MVATSFHMAWLHNLLFANWRSRVDATGPCFGVSRDFTFLMKVACCEPATALLFDVFQGQEFPEERHLCAHPGCFTPVEHQMAVSVGSFMPIATITPSFDSGTELASDSRTAFGQQEAPGT